jgi:hypothetical protein
LPHTDAGAKSQSPHKAAAVVGLLLDSGPGVVGGAGCCVRTPDTVVAEDGEPVLQRFDDPEVFIGISFGSGDETAVSARFHRSS